MQASQRRTVKSRKRQELAHHENILSRKRADPSHRALLTPVNITKQAQLPTKSRRGQDQVNEREVQLSQSIVHRTQKQMHSCLLYLGIIQKRQPGREYRADQIEKRADDLPGTALKEQK